MRTIACILALWTCLARAQQPFPALEGETLSGKKLSLPAAAGGQAAVVIIGFTRASQAQSKEWSVRVRGRFPAWSIAVLEDVPRLVRGMVARSIQSGTPSEQHDRFVLLYHGEKLLKQAAGFEKPDDAYVLALDGAGVIRWRFHGAVTDTAMKALAEQFVH